MTIEKAGLLDRGSVNSSAGGLDYVRIIEYLKE